MPKLPPPRGRPRPGTDRGTEKAISTGGYAGLFWIGVRPSVKGCLRAIRYSRTSAGGAMKIPIPRRRCEARASMKIPFDTCPKGSALPPVKAASGGAKRQTLHQRHFSLPLSFSMSRQPQKFRSVVFLNLPFFFWQLAWRSLSFTWMFWQVCTYEPRGIRF